MKILHNRFLDKFHLSKYSNSPNMLIYFKMLVMENICRFSLSVGSSNLSCGSELSLCQKWALAMGICWDFWFISNPRLLFAKQLHALGSAPLMYLGAAKLSGKYKPPQIPQVAFPANRSCSDTNQWLKSFLNALRKTIYCCCHLVEATAA